MAFKLFRTNAFMRDDKGTVALLMGVAAIPVFLAAGVALDTNRVIDANVNLQNLADGAALTGAASQGTAEQKKQQAINYLAHNKIKTYGVSYTWQVSVTDNIVNVSLKSSIKGTLTQVAFGNGAKTGMMTEARASWETTPAYNACIVATDANADGAIRLSSNGDFISDTCFLHANSTDSEAVRIETAKTVTAQGIHTRGDSLNQIGGLYVNAPWSKTMAEVLENTVAGPGHGSSTSITVNGNTALSNRIYDDIKVESGTGTFTPGIHYVKGDIEIESQAELKGEGVTIVLLDDEARIRADQGGKLNVRAPTRQELINLAASTDELRLAGVAVAASSSHNDDDHDDIKIQLGSGSNIRGAIYMPGRKLRLETSSGYNANSEYAPILARKIDIRNTGSLTVGFDYAAYGFALPNWLTAPETSQVSLVE